jgi:putative FmdB family regulatory protein
VATRRSRIEISSILYQPSSNMPTYDYQCDACEHQFEVFQSINEEHLKKCPKCKKNKLRRLFGTGAAIMFKGSGFYQTDYRSDSYKKGAEADKKASESSSSSGESKSETKSSESKSSGESKKAESKKKAKE